MTENVTPEEVSESPFEAAIRLLNVVMEQPGGPPISDLNDSIGMIQSLLLVSLHNQAAKQTALLEDIAARLKQED